MSGKTTRADIERFIAAARDLHPNMEYACTHGGCYKFHLLLKQAYPEAVPWISTDRSHVVSRIGDDLFDISGRVGSAMGKAASQYHEMDDKEKKIASKWSYR